jgi:hypothetical protein
MNTKSVIAIAILATLSAIASIAAAADDSYGTTAKPLSRAEVLADLVIYRESGLAQLELSENIGQDNPRKVAAKAKYNELRKSPRYAELVKRYGGGEAKLDVAHAP